MIPIGNIIRVRELEHGGRLAPACAIECFFSGLHGVVPAQFVSYDLFTCSWAVDTLSVILLNEKSFITLVAENESPLREFYGNYVEFWIWQVHPGWQKVYFAPKATELISLDQF
jgi:hypothetical protein